MQTILVIALERAAGFILVPFPSHNPKLPEPLCFLHSCSSSVLALVLPAEIYPAGLELAVALFAQHSPC